MLVAYYLNPLAGILEGFRNVLFHGTAPNLATLGASRICPPGTLHVTPVR